MRYHFHTREDLLAACVDEIERVRAAEAEQIIDGLDPLGRRDSDRTARLLLRAYYEPTADGLTTHTTTATGTVWSIIDCGRESPRLGALLGTHRRAAHD